MTTQQTTPDGDSYDGPVVRIGQGSYVHDYTPEPAGDLVPFIVGMTYGIILVSIVWLVCIWST